jgi:carboxylesterase
MNNKKASKIIRKNSSSVLYEDPEELFRREKEFLNQPFFFEGTNGKGVLLIHGWTTTPYEVRRLGKYLNENGYTVAAPLLRGHGSVPRDLESVIWKDWVQDAEKAYYELKLKCNKIYVGGTSIGSSLAVMMDKNHPETAGLLLMAMPYKIRFESLAFPLIKILKKIKNYNNKLYPPTFGGNNTITRLISYQSYSMTSALEAVKLIKEARKNIPFITKPCFLIQSLSDHIITKKSAQEIYDNIKSEVKKIKYIKRAYHTFISDIKNEHVFEEILEFFDEN